MLWTDLTVWSLLSSWTSVEQCCIETNPQRVALCHRAILSPGNQFYLILGFTQLPTDFPDLFPPGGEQVIKVFWSDVLNWLERGCGHKPKSRIDFMVREPAPHTRTEIRAFCRRFWFCHGRYSI